MSAVFSRKRYPSDLTWQQWKILEPHIPAERPGGRHREHPILEIVNAILYRVNTGCSWNSLPHDFPPCKTVYHYFRAWTLDGTWQKLHDIIRDKAREKAGKTTQPSACILDSQSVKTSKKGDTEGLTRQKVLKAGNDIFLLTH